MTDILEAAKRAGRITEAKLLAKRAEGMCKRRPYPSEERMLIRDMRLVIVNLLDEVANSPAVRTLK